MTSDISKKKKTKKQELQELAELQQPLPALKEELLATSVAGMQLPDANPDATPQTEDISIEKPKKIKRIVKPRTEKQIQSLAQGRLKRDQQQNERRKIKEQEDIILKQELEKKLIDKAIKVKKKQLKRIEIFDDLSDEEPKQPTSTPSQVIQKQKQIKPKIIEPSSNPYVEFKKKYNIH